MKRARPCLTIFGIWVLASLLAIACIGSHPYLGLGIALLGGVAFGAAAFLSDGRSATGARQRPTHHRKAVGGLSRDRPTIGRKGGQT